MAEGPVRSGGAAGTETGGRRRVSPLRRLWYLLLVVQFPAVLVPSFYARETPMVWGIPFFYWYQFAWVLGAALLTAIVYLATRRTG